MFAAACDVASKIRHRSSIDQPPDTDTKGDRQSDVGRTSVQFTPRPTTAVTAADEAVIVRVNDFGIQFFKLLSGCNIHVTRCGV